MKREEFLEMVDEIIPREEWAEYRMILGLCQVRG